MIYYTKLIETTDHWLHHCNFFFQNYIPDELPIHLAVPVFTGTPYPVVTQPLQEEVIAQNDLENPILAINNNEESESDQGSEGGESENQDFPEYEPNGPTGRRHIRQHNISLLRISIHSREEEIYQ